MATAAVVFGCGLESPQIPQAHSNSMSAHRSFLLSWKIPHNVSDSEDTQAMVHIVGDFNMYSFFFCKEREERVQREIYPF
jgi:hypothetical protein